MKKGKKAAERPLLYLEEERPGCHLAHSEQSHDHVGIEIVCVKRGSMICNLGGDRLRLQAGDVCFINGKRLHRIVDCENGESRLKVLIMDPEILTGSAEIYESYIRPVLEDDSFTHVRFTGSGGHAAAIEEIMREVERLNGSTSCGAVLELVAQAHRLFHCIYCAYCGREARDGALRSNAAVPQKMIRYIREHYEEPLTLAEIAAAGHISKSQCNKLFKQYTDQSPIAYLNTYRLERSRSLLRSTEDSVATIAQACGFTEQSYYNRLFLREYGCTPLAYRKGERR